MPLAESVRVLGSNERGYRMRARLHVRDGKFGFFREGTHDLCEAGPTHQLLPDTVDALLHLRSLVQTTPLTSCELSENAAATERAVLLELAPSATAPSHVDPIDGVSGLLFIDHEQGHVTVSYGSPYVTDRIATSDGDVVLTHHVQSFFQGNRYLLAELVARVIAYVPAGAVTDLYAGVGLFAISLARRGDVSVVAVEGDRSSARDLESNAAPFGADVHVQHVSVERHLQRRGLQRPDTVLVDPPRTGLSQEAMSALLGLKVPRIVYVSCDPATLARDVRRFSEVGYRLL
jgi:23S rRNA (uracil1939-C5)-methyltransferase